MEKVKSKISLIAIMFLWAVTILTGCGNPYKNMRLSLDSVIAIENDQYTYDVDLNNGQSTAFSFDVRVEGAKKKVSTDVSVSSTQTEIVTIDETSKEGNKTHITMKAHRVGQSVVTIKSAEGNLSKSVIVRVHIPLEDMQVPSHAVYVERGVQVDARQFLTFVPSATDRSDLVLSLEGQSEEIKESVTLEGNTFSVDKTSTFSSFTLKVQSKFNADIEEKELTVQVIDVVQPEEIVPKYAKGNEYVELTKSASGNYLLSMAQNSSDIQDFTRNLYFFVRKQNAITGQVEDVLLDESTYTVGVVDAFGDLKDEYSNAYVDVTKMDNYFTIMELSMGTSTITFGYTHNQLGYTFLKKMAIDIEVQYYPEKIIVTNNGQELNATNPMIIYDDDRVNGVNNAIAVSVLTVGNNVLARSPFYIRLVGTQKEDYKVVLSNRYGQIDENLAYTAQDAPFYITHNYPQDVEIGQFELEMVSAVPDVTVAVRVPLEFVRGEMNINTNQDIYYLNVDGDSVVGGSMQQILFTGINSADVWQRIQIVGMNQDLISYAWLDDHSGLEIKANEEGATGRFTVRLIAPNGNVKVITIVVFHELQTAGVYVGNVVSTNTPVLGVDRVESVQDQDIPVYEFLAGSTIPLNYVLNGQNGNQFFEGVTVTPTVTSRGVTISNDRKYLLVGNSSIPTTVELKIEGYDQYGQSRSSVKYIIFKVQPVLPISEVNMAKADGSTSYRIYSSSHLSTLPDDSYKKAMVRYRVYPASATYRTPVWNIYGPQGEKIAELNYSTEERSTQNLNVSYAGQTKQYICTYYGCRISFVLDLNDLTLLEVSANLSEFDLLTLRVGVSLTQEYKDINNNRTLFVSDEAYVTIQVLKPTKVSAIRFENLEKENGEYVYHFDIRDMTQNGQLFTEGNTASIHTLVYPYNAVNTNVEIKTTLYTSRDGGVTYTTTGETGAHYLDYHVVSTPGKEYEKKLNVELLRNLNEDNLSRYIEVTINAVDSSLGSGYTVSNSFRVYLLDGSKATPFRIRSASDIDDMRKGLHSHYLLINDIDLSYYITSRMNGSWQPIGSYDAPFTGSLSSFMTEERLAKYTISGLSLVESTNTTQSLSHSVVEGHNEYYGGLFGYVGSGASIQNISINVTKLTINQNKGISGDNLYVGVLAGYVARGASIAGIGIFDNNGATEKVKDAGISFVSSSPITAYIGGMVGYNEGDIVAYNFTLDNSSQVSYMAGNKVNLVFAISDEVITGANSTVYVGGLAGYHSGQLQTTKVGTTSFGLESYDIVVEINPTMSYHVENTQYALTNASSAVGGIVGSNSGSITGFEAKSKISAFDNIGGLVGRMDDGVLSNVTVAPVLRGHERIGGVIGTYVGASTLDDIHVEFYERNDQNSIQNSSIIGSNYVGGMIGYSTVGNDNEIENISLYSYSKTNAIAYSPTANNAFFGDVVATGENAYLSAGIGRWDTENAISITFNNWFVLASMQAVKAEATLSGVVSSTSAVTANAMALTITTPNEITDKEAFAFGGLTYMSSYAIVNGTWVGATYEELMTKTYQFSDGNEQTGFNGNEYTGIAYETALFYTYPAYTIMVDGQSKAYPINLAGNKTAEDEKVKLLVNLPPISVQCESRQAYISMIRLADRAYDDNGNIIGDSDGSLKRELEKANLKPLDEILRASAIPAFLSNARITLTSSNSSVAEVVTENGATYLKLKGVGVSTIEVTSLYDATLTASADICVVDQILDFGIYEDDAFTNCITLKNTEENPNLPTLDLEKGSTLAVFAGMQKQWNGLTTQFDTSKMGVRYTIDESSRGALALNGEEGTTWDSNLGQVTLKGLVSGDVTITACPYYVIGNDKILVESQAVSFTIHIINGTQSIYLDSQSTNITFEPSNTTQRFVANVVTDKEEEQLVLSLTDNNAKTYTFVLDTEKFETETWNNKTIELGYLTLSLEQYSKNNNLMTFVFHVSVNLEQLLTEHKVINEDTNEIEVNEIEVKEILSTPITFDLSFYVLEYNKSLTSLDEDTTSDGKYTVSGSGLSIASETEQAVLDSIKESITNYPTLSVTMTTQELQEGALTFYHYPNNLEKKNEEGQFVFNGEEVPYDNILSGVPGLLKIDYLPQYANIAYLEISSSAVAGEVIRFDQLLKTYDGTAISYVRDILSTDQTQGKARLNQRSVDWNGAIFFNGEYYVRTLIPSSIPTGSTYTITVDAYRYTLNGGVEKVVTISKELVVLTPPSVEIKTNAVAVARGTAQDFTLKINGLDETTMLTFDQSTLTKGSVEYSYGNYFTITNHGGDNYQVWVSSSVPSGAELKIVYSVSKRINGTTITETNKNTPLLLWVADFVVNQIGVDRVYNNRFVGELNQFYELKVVLADVSYNSHILGVARAIRELETNLSKLLNDNGTSSTWWVREGISFTQIDTNRYSGFDASVVDGVVKVKNTLLTTNALLQARVYILYDEEGIKALPYDKITGKAVQDFTYDFGFNCYRYTDESNPTPIYNLDQFIEMVDNGVGDYRLMSDITLTNWTPRDSYHTISDATSGSSVAGVISSLDGNGYVIEIESFNDEAIASTGVAGLFATVHEDTILKNLVVLLAPTVANTSGEASIEIDKEGSGPLSSGQSTDKFDITIDMKGAPSAVFGTIAGVNNGMITNCYVTYNTEAYQDKRINEMLGKPANQVKDKQDILSFEEYELYNNNNSGENLKVKDEYRFYQKVEGRNNFHRSIYDDHTGQDGIITLKGRTLTSIFVETDLGVSAYVGGLVGRNNGYITNSHVEHISIKGSGYVAGLVAENTNKISSSYYFDGNIKNNFNSEEEQSGTAGLVAVNSGAIAYSYVEGRNSVAIVQEEGDKNILNTSITRVDVQSFTGYQYENINYTGNLAQSMRSTYSAINTNTHAGGFVYSNSGTITNSYANILVNSTANSAGFVYDNRENGAIKEVYSLSSVRINQRNASQFSGRTSSGAYLNKGTIEHSVYLKVEGMAAVVNGENVRITDNVTDDIYADYISMTQFGRYSSFTGYAFNQDYKDNSAEDIAKAVWFIPEIAEYQEHQLQGGDNTKSSTYFNIMDRAYYLPARPQLVSANLETRSSYYCAGSSEDENGNIKYQYQHMAADEGSETNPYLVYDATLLDTRMNDIQKNRNELAKQNDGVQSKYPEPYNVRLIRDFSYSEKPDHKATTYQVTFSGILDGNGMEVQDLVITASKNSDEQLDAAKGITQAGWFGNIEGGTVKNLSIEVLEVSATGIPYVGVLSGVIHDSNIYNVTINPANGNAFISGANVLGGLSGLVYGNSQLVGITSNVSITSYFKSGSNLFNFENTIATSGSFAVLQIDDRYDNLAKYTNYDKVSYVGGIVGIMDASAPEEIDEDSVAVAQTSQARRLSVGDNVRLAGEIVGGIMGYMGRDIVSVNDEIRIGTSASLSIIASRVAGGLVGENHGKLQRSYVAHDVTTQESIDQAQKLGVYSDLNYRQLFGTPSDGKGTSRNAHFIGGLVGLNMGGSIENSYNKVTVYSPNARAAGGLVGLTFGGNILSSYTTASVGAYSTAGGLVGREGKIEVSTSGEGDTYTSVLNETERNRITTAYYMRLTADYYDRENMAKHAQYQGAVAANVFSENDLNLMLRPNGEISPYYELGAFIGKIDSINFGDTNTFESYNFDRMKKEVNFAQKLSIACKDDTGKNATYAIPEFAGSTLPLRTGGVYEYNPTTKSNSYYLYRDLGYQVSLRTQEEFVARRMLWQNDQTSWKQNENESWNTYQFLDSKGKAESGEDGKPETIITSENAFAKANEIVLTTQSIYNTYLEMYWNGYDINQNLEVIDEAYVYPDLKAETYDMIVYVYDVDDLKKINVYPDATFILMNDINLTEAWTPLAQEKAFVGTLTSNTGNTFAIRNLYFTKDSIGLTGNKTPNNTNIGLIARAKRATFSNFTLTVKADEGGTSSTNLTEGSVTVDAGYGLNYGNLVGYVEGHRDPTTFTNISIMCEGEEGTATLKLNNINSYGGVVGAGNNISFNTVTVGNTIQVEVSSLISSNKTRAHGLGGMLGVGMQEVLPPSDNYYQPISLTGASVNNHHITVTGDNLTNNHGSLYIGGAIGYLEEQNRTVGKLKYTLDVTVSNVTLEENITDNTTGKITTLAIGGVIGAFSGNTNNAVTQELNNTLNGWKANTITIISQYQKASDTSIGGWVGYQSTSATNPNNNLTYALSTIAPTISITAGTGNVGGLFGKVIGVSLTSAVTDEKATIDASNVAVAGDITNYGTFAGSMQNTSSISNIKVSNYLNKISSAMDNSANINTLGGLVGTTNGVSITACEVKDTTTNSISATVHGGVVGNATISNGNTWTDIIVATNTLSGDSVGGLVGWLVNDGTISNVQIETNLHGDNIGGLSGIVEGNGTISKVITKGQLTNTGEEVGGLIGSNGGNTISQCIAEMNIITASSSQKVGGLVGINHGNINNSYSQGYIDISNAEISNLTGFGGLVGVNTNTGTLSRNYTISRYVYHSDAKRNIEAYYNTDKGGLVGTNNGTIETYNWYVSDITPYSNKLGTSLYMDELLGKTLHELVGETTPTSSETWWIHKNDSNEFVENKTPQLRWAKELTDSIIETSNSGTIDNILYANSVNAQEVAYTGLVILKEDTTKSVQLTGSNNGVIFGGRTGGNGLQITGNNNSVIDYFRVQNNGYLVGEENDGLLNRVSYIGDQDNFMNGSNDGQVRDSQLLTTADLSNYSNSINTIYAKQDLGADAGWGNTKGDTTDLIIYNHEGKRSTRSSVVLPNQFKITQGHSPSNYTTLDFNNTWIIIRTSNKQVESNDITRRTLNYGYPVLRWTLQENYRMEGNEKLLSQYYWELKDAEYLLFTGSENDMTLSYDIDLGNKLWTPVNGDNKTLTGNLENINDTDIDRTIKDTFGNDYTSDRGKTLNRIYNMTVYNNTLDNVGLFQTLASASNIRMENALVYNTKAGANVGTLAGRLANGIKVASVNSAIVAKSATNVGGIAGTTTKDTTTGTISYAYNIYTTGGRSLVGEDKAYSYTNGIVGGTTAGQIVGSGNIVQAYTSLQNGKVTGNGTTTSCFNGSSDLTTSILEGFNWQVWARINDAKHYYSLPYIDGNIPFWIDKVKVADDPEYLECENVRVEADIIQLTVDSAAGLAIVAYIQNNPDLGQSVDVTLTKDITLSGNIWTPIGTADHPYTGTFDGQGYHITGITATRVHDTHDDQDNAGLFGVTSGATIKNLAIENAQYTFTDNNEGKTVSHVGALVGNATGGAINDVTINNVNLYTNGNNVGGLIGTMNGTTITNANITNVRVYANDIVGGLIGSSTNGTLQTSFIENSSLGQVVSSIMPNNSVKAQPYQGGLIATAINTNVLEGVAKGINITNQSSDLSKVGELFGKVEYTSTTTSMTTGIHNLYAYDTTFKGNSIGQLYSHDVGFDGNYNVTMLYTNENIGTSGDLRTGGLPTRNAILTDNPWWSNLLAHIDNSNADLSQLVSRPYYVASDSTTATNIGLGDLLATLSMRYYGENIPASKYKLINHTGNSSIYYDDNDKTIIKSAGTSYYPIKGLTLIGEWNGTDNGIGVSIGYKNIDKIFDKVGNSTFNDLSLQLGISLINTATNVTMNTVKIDNLEKPFIMTVEGNDSNYTDITLGCDTVVGGVFANTINGGTFTDFAIDAFNVTGGGFAENITNGTVNNITVTAHNVKGAGIASSMTGGSITDCSVSGTITDGYSITVGKVAGGLLGYSTIALGEGNTCSATLNLDDKADYVGGIVGYYAPTTTDQNTGTYSGASLSNGAYVGGLYGYATKAVQGGTVTSNITIENANYAGAIVGGAKYQVGNTITLPDRITINNVIYGGAIAGQCASINGDLSLNKSIQVTITGDASKNSVIGGLVGCMANEFGLTGVIKVSNSSLLTGTLQGKVVGGIVGQAIANISNITTSASLTLQNNANSNDAVLTAIGGIVGELRGGTVSGVINNATIKTITPSNPTYKKLYNIGGIVGKMTSGSITSVTNNAEILAEESTNVGGIVGYVSAFTDFKNNTVNQRVIGSTYVGGLVGYHYVSNGDTRRISDQYKNNNSFGTNVEVHSKFEVGLYVGDEGDETCKHDNDEYYYVTFTDSSNNKDYSVIRQNQVAYFVQDNISDSERNIIYYENANNLRKSAVQGKYTYETLGKTDQGRVDYWGYFNFASATTDTKGGKDNIVEASWFRHANNKHELKLKEYNLSQNKFYAADHGNNGEAGWFVSSDGGGINKDYQTMNQYFACITIVRIASDINYTLSMFNEYSNATDISSWTFTSGVGYSSTQFSTYQDNNVLPYYVNGQKYAIYNQGDNEDETNYASENYMLLGLRQVVATADGGFNNDLYDATRSTDSQGTDLGYKPSKNFTIAINSMGAPYTDTKDGNNKYQLVVGDKINLLNEDNTISSNTSYSYLWAAETLKVPVFNKYENRQIGAQTLEYVKNTLFSRNINANSTGNGDWQNSSSGYVMANRYTEFKFCGGDGNWKIDVYTVTPLSSGNLPAATRQKHINDVSDNWGVGNEPSIESLRDSRIGDVYDTTRYKCYAWLRKEIAQDFIPFIQFIGYGSDDGHANIASKFSSSEFYLINKA